MKKSATAKAKNDALTRCRQLMKTRSCRSRIIYSSSISFAFAFQILYWKDSPPRCVHCRSHDRLTPELRPGSSRPRHSTITRKRALWESHPDLINFTKTLVEFPMELELTIVRKTRCSLLAPGTVSVRKSQLWRVAASIVMAKLLRKIGCSHILHERFICLLSLPIWWFQCSDGTRPWN